VPAFRDLRNPEVIHFPGAISSMVALSLCAFLAALILIAAVWEGSPAERIAWGAPPLAVLWLIQRAWPRQIVLGERGVWQYNIFGHRKFMIAWDDLRDPEPTGEIGRRQRLGVFTNQAIRLASKTSRRRITHTSRHDDSERFLKLVRQRIAHPPTVF